ncbi:hypothetical protein FYK55_15950 [Roseiconus nitratireducens]|uniref:HEAT repeat domain-containing protein n=1 Tax=Roseiconus nitratireducens TaxID=2605748 RepID=A0A5M6D484_9BACT|nr:hypothetical protein [Roseiconus nitratireducens]KAA5542291.1 hypothetical protein FYK55_15950 [Roseiconus nitratireducens]
MQPARLLLCLLPWFLSPPAGAQQPTDEDLSTWVKHLSDDSYTARLVARERLLQYAERGAEESEAVEARLRQPVSPRRDLESYLARRSLLQAMAQVSERRRLDRFLHDPAFDRDRLEGWSAFRRHAGDDSVSRRLFATIFQRFPDQLQRLSDSQSASLIQPPETLDRNDSAAWAMALVAACESHEQHLGENTFRLVSALRCFGTGPLPNSEGERHVIKRLVGAYLQTSPADVRDRMTIGVRFECREQTLQLCRLVLDDPSQSPSATVTAMLAASALEGPSETIDAWIQRYGTDSRTSHVWRSLVEPKTTRRTQVRDVAAALQLHREGRDPREHGFTALIADPILVFQAYSLGFASEQERQEAQRQRISIRSDR